MELKKALFDQLDGACRADTILATNISSLSISEIAGGTRYGARVAGIYFFHPAPVMKLVEVISTVVTSPEIAETLAPRSRDLGKTPVRVSDRAGFVVNALLFPYLKSGRGFYDCRRPSTPTAPAEDHGRAPVPTDVAVPQLHKVRET